MKVLIDVPFHISVLLKAEQLKATSKAGKKIPMEQIINKRLEQSFKDDNSLKSLVSELKGKNQ